MTPVATTGFRLLSFSVAAALLLGVSIGYRTLRDSGPERPPPPGAPRSAAVEALRARPPTPAGDADSQAIRSTLRAYEAAYARLDIAALRAVQPALTEEQAVELQSAFARYGSLRLRIESPEITVEGDAATAYGRVTRTMTPRRGRPQTTHVPMAFRLRREGSRWVIAGLEVRGDVTK